MPPRTRRPAPARTPQARRRREQHVERTYGVSAPALAALETFQDGRCWGCRRATGASKNLAMDHNHRSGEARMLLCMTCNHKVLGHFRDDPQGLLRLALGLLDPPSRAAWLAPGMPHPGFEHEDPELSWWFEDYLCHDYPCG